jgi:hypothetical protein
LALDLLAWATSGFTGSPDVVLGGSGVHGFGTEFGHVSGLGFSLKSSDGSNSAAANVSDDHGGFQSPVPLDLVPSTLGLGDKSALDLTGSLHRTQHAGSTFLSASDALFGGELGDLLG